MQFADGTQWDVTAIAGLMPEVYHATSADDTLIGWSGIDNIDGGAGNDNLNSDRGNDILNGGAGNDFLNGGDGEDTLNGGEGDDILNDSSGDNLLKGGQGNDVLIGTGSFEGGQGDDELNAGNPWMSDTYLFNLGDGRDTILDSGIIGRDDTLRLGSGISASAVHLARNGNDMIFKISEADQVTIKNWFESDSYYIEHVQFADGTQWDLTTINKLSNSIWL